MKKYVFSFLLLVTSAFGAHDDFITARHPIQTADGGRQFLKDFCVDSEKTVCADYRKTNGRVRYKDGRQRAAFSTLVQVPASIIQKCGPDGMSAQTIQVEIKGVNYVTFCPGVLVYFGSMAGAKFPLTNTLTKAMAFAAGHEIFHSVDDHSQKNKFQKLYATFFDCMKKPFVPDLISEKLFSNAKHEMVAHFGGGLAMASQLSDPKMKVEEKANLLKDSLEILCDLSASKIYPPSGVRFQMLLRNQELAESIGCKRDNFCTLSGLPLS